MAIYGEWHPPEEFEEYRLVRQLGSGAMGQVFLAHDLALDRLVAIKFVTEHQEAKARDRFVIEARAAARVQHPNVVTVHRVAELGTRPYIVSEYVRGTSLDKIRKPVDWKRALELGVGLARGLAAAHGQRVLHRDIKPANSILRETGEPVLVDFGLAKLVDAGGASRQPRARTSIRLTPCSTKCALATHRTEASPHTSSRRW